ncbi:hypothetical protein BJY04DRAFT_64023 [Aspergillus karnatakaensis]|uniref:EI24 domain-containing protein n=1 Tax=Aspergillus karnatakaensis TaxID=1810916 RepID=UPI003CCDFB72
MSDRAKEALRAESANLRAIAQDVAFSGAYFYPFRGILHLTTHPSLLRPLTTKLLQTLLLGLGITTTLFTFTYVPQAALMTFTSGPFFAPIAAALLVLSEASALTHFIARGWILRDVLVDIFDQILLDKGHETLVSQGRVLNKAGKRWGLGHMSKKPFGDGGGILKGILRWAAMLPLNFIPVVGTVAYVYVAGKRAGPGLHERYFQLRGFSRREKGEWVEGKRGAYTGLGMASVVLEMVPFASMAFEFSNAVGAALWASDLERARQ